jgi:hypothetical protein
MVLPVTVLCSVLGQDVSVAEDILVRGANLFNKLLSFPMLCSEGMASAVDALPASW